MYFAEKKILSARFTAIFAAASRMVIVRHCGQHQAGLRTAHARYSINPPLSELAEVRCTPKENTGQMHVIFLDIDGVLNCKRTPNPRKLPYIVDPLLLKRFVQLVDRIGAEIVLSSTWRYDPAGLFSAKHWGIPFIDVLPDMPKRPRRDEILAWLKAHPDTDRFAVLDDEDDELDELPLFQPSAATGLTDEIVEGIADYLLGRTDRDMRCNRIKRFLQNMHAVFKGHEG